MLIKTISETFYDGMFKIQAVENCQDTVFYARNYYLADIRLEELSPEAELNELLTEQLFEAGLSAAVELKAVEYLARAEQSRFGLKRKLLQKKFDSKYIERALDFLEEKNYLSDSRFARAWLNTRKINHYEGASKLLAELQNRGINKSIAEAAVNNFFEENDELEICKKAFEKLKSKGKEGDKLIASLLNAGFNYKMIRQLMSDN